MRRITTLRRDAVVAALSRLSCEHRSAGLSVLLRLPDNVSDEAIASQAIGLGLAPTPLSPWYAKPTAAHAGLLLGVTNVPEARAESYCRKLVGLIARSP
jgi:GntR family transcriptional regulator/MocR family aminotransferase